MSGQVRGDEATVGDAPAAPDEGKGEAVQRKIVSIGLHFVKPIRKAEH